MPDDFRYDVFISHSPKDKAVVRPLAQRLRADGLRVWLDDWELKPGDDISSKIEEGLEHSRVLVLCMSANAFGSDWAQLESQTFRFRDPLNKQRRFIPLRLDETELKGSLAQFLHINWLTEDREQAYAKLLETCRPPAKSLTAEAEGHRKRFSEKATQLDYKTEILSYAFSPNGERALSGSRDKTVRLWDVETGRCLRVLEGHTDDVYYVVWGADKRHALSGGGPKDATVRLWDVETGRCLRVLKGHTNFVMSLAWSADSSRALSCSGDATVRLWDVETGRCLRALEGHTGAVWSVAWSADGRLILSGSSDNTVRLWDEETGRCLRVLKGHTDGIISLAPSSNGGRALSGSRDKTVRLWDVETGRCLRVLEGHTGIIWSVAWSADERLALSGGDKTVRLWDVETGRCLRALEGHTGAVRSVAWNADQHQVLSGDINGGIRVWDLSESIGRVRTPVIPVSNSAAAPEQVEYTNAKVLLVGESGAGKTGLSKRRALGDWEPSDSTVGAWATQWKLDVDSAEGVEREVWLWDFGGQADQRLIHQLYMDETALAVLVFDGQKEDVLETLGQWDRDLTRASRKEFTKLLVAGRVDAGGLRVSRAQIEAFVKERGYVGFLETSAKQNVGCDELRQAILGGILWENIPWRSTPLLFKRLKDEIIRLKDEGRVLQRFNELRDTLQLRLQGEFRRFTDEELKAVVGLLTGPGVVWELKFGSWVLLQPERINAYAQAVIQTLREDEQERGCLPEERALNGDLKYDSSLERLEPDEERFVLLAMHQTLVERGLCLRQHTDKGPQLIFPSYYRRERPELVDHPALLVSYRFSGFLDDIYASLVVRLHHTRPFQHDQLWRYAADFRTLTGKQLGVKLTRLSKGAAQLEVYSDPAVSTGEKIIFSRYVHEHLLQSASDVVRLRHYVCPHCGTPVGNLDVAMRRLEQGKRDLLCINCERRIPLWDRLEELSGSPEIREQVRALQDESAVVLDNESRERTLVGDVISTVALAGQLSREYPMSEQGVDMEVEFRNDAGEPTGRKLLLQIRPDDSYRRWRRPDGAEVFVIKDEARARYWMSQPFPVLLVVRSPEGEVRWMDVRGQLTLPNAAGIHHPGEIVFEGERLDVMSVRRWRDSMLQGTRELHLRQSLADPDPKARAAAMSRVAELSPDAGTRELLSAALRKDSSPDVRIAAAEALARWWWREFGVRRELRSRVKAERKAVVKARLADIVAGARDHLSGYWEARLTGQPVAGDRPETLPGYPALRVSKFRLRDIGPFHDTEVVELQPGVNVFLGDNAAGKTSILRCLALAAVGAHAANEVEGNAGGYLRKGARRGVIEVLFELIPDPNALPAESGYVAVGLQITAGSSRFVPVQELTLRRPGKAGEHLPNSVEYLGALRSEWGAQFGFVSAYGAVRTFQTSQSALQGEMGKQENEWVRSLFDAEAPLMNPGVLSKLIRGDTSNIEDAPAGGLHPRLTKMLRASLGHLFPEVGEFFSEGENDIQLNGTPLRFGELSDGYRSLFALIGHLLRCSMRVRDWKNDPTRLNGIVLIDEIDLHLHPTWQSHVVQDFHKAFPHLQLVASTHSPLVVGALRREDVLIMRREEGGIVVRRPEFGPQGLGVAGILTSIFDLGSTIDQPTLDKISRRLLLHSSREGWGPGEEQEYKDLTDELARLGFNREFSDPYFERFAVAMANRHKATIKRLTPAERQEMDAYADRLLAEVMRGEGE